MKSRQIKTKSKEGASVITDPKYFSTLYYSKIYKNDPRRIRLKAMELYFKGAHKDTLVGDNTNESRVAFVAKSLGMRKSTVELYVKSYMERSIVGLMEKRGKGGRPKLDKESLFDIPVKPQEERVILGTKDDQKKDIKTIALGENQSLFPAPDPCLIYTGNPDSLPFELAKENPVGKFLKFRRWIKRSPEWIRIGSLILFIVVVLFLTVKFATMFVGG